MVFVHIQCCDLHYRLVEELCNKLLLGNDNYMYHDRKQIPK